MLQWTDRYTHCLYRVAEKTDTGKVTVKQDVRFPAGKVQC